MCRMFLPDPASQGATQVLGAFAAIPAGRGLVEGGTEIPDKAK